VLCGEKIMIEKHKEGNNSKNPPKPEKLVKLNDLLKELMDGKFTGYIKVNFSQGGIGRIEKFEEILK
jgi:hypothetical protein